MTLTARVAPASWPVSGDRLEAGATRNALNGVIGRSHAARRVAVDETKGGWREPPARRHDEMWRKRGNLPTFKTSLRWSCSRSFSLCRQRSRLED